jgi:hypothetical protein
VREVDARPRHPCCYVAIYPVTLTGLGERVRLASPQVDLDTHITDVVNLIEFEDLHDVVLLGHSRCANEPCAWAGLWR